MVFILFLFITAGSDERLEISSYVRYSSMNAI